MSLAGTAGTGFAEKAVREATPVPKKPTATRGGLSASPRRLGNWTPRPLSPLLSLAALGAGPIAWGIEAGSEGTPATVPGRSVAPARVHRDGQPGLLRAQGCGDAGGG